MVLFIGIISASIVMTISVMALDIIRFAKKSEFWDISKFDNYNF